MRQDSITAKLEPECYTAMRMITRAPYKLRSQSVSSDACQGEEPPICFSDRRLLLESMRSNVDTLQGYWRHSTAHTHTRK